MGFVVWFSGASIYLFGSANLVVGGGITIHFVLFLFFIFFFFCLDFTSKSAGASSLLSSNFNEYLGGLYGNMCFTLFTFPLSFLLSLLFFLDGQEGWGKGKETRGRWGVQGRAIIGLAFGR